MLYPFLPITATSPQRPLTSVSKMAVVERFDCILSEAIMTCSVIADAIINCSNFPGRLVQKEASIWNVLVRHTKRYGRTFFVFEVKLINSSICCTFGIRVLLFWSLVKDPINNNSSGDGGSPLKTSRFFFFNLYLCPGAAG